LIKTVSLVKIGEDVTTMEVLRDGSVQERKHVLSTISITLLKTLLNVIGNVLENETYEDRIIKRQVLQRYASTYATLLDREVPLKEKKKLLQKAGYVYLPIFLEIVGDDVEEFAPKEQGRTLKDCPVPKCRSKQLKKLSNHLHDVHRIQNRKEWLQQAKEINEEYDDDTDDTDVEE